MIKRRGKEPGETRGLGEGSIMREETATHPPPAKSRMWHIVVKELRFLWNLVDPRHGRATVFVSRQNGQIVKKS